MPKNRRNFLILCIATLGISWLMGEAHATAAKSKLTGKCRFCEPVWAKPKNPIDDAQTRQLMLDIALEASARSKMPRSGHARGASLLAVEGLILSGCSIEGISSKDSLPAELVALGSAISEGVQDIYALVLVSDQGDPPCPQCLHLLVEIAPACKVVCATTAGQIVCEDNIQTLNTRYCL